ncbi:MAG TPA: hypothetical protein VFI25_09400 [Planctomycetota bacterium]|jgi:hypothetical protein|nr:hypothetical protein [Planctomycetota bacterium]
MLRRSNLFVVAEKVPDTECETPLVVEKRRRNLEEAARKAAQWRFRNGRASARRPPGR